MDKEISTIAVMTSGGDSPGMNAALRAVVRGANRYNLTIWGIYRGYQGLIEDKFVELDSEKVSNIVQINIKLKLIFNFQLLKIEK